MSLLENPNFFEISSEDTDKILESDYKKVIMENMISTNFVERLISLFNNKSRFGLYISKGIMEYSHYQNLPEQILGQDMDASIIEKITEDSDKSFYIGNTSILIGRTNKGLDIFGYDNEYKNFDFINSIEREKNKVMTKSYFSRFGQPHFGQYTTTGFEEYLDFELKELENFELHFDIGSYRKPEHHIKLFFYPDAKAYLVQR